MHKIRHLWTVLTLRKQRIARVLAFPLSVVFIVDALVTSANGQQQKPIESTPFSRLAEVVREELAADPALARRRISVSNGILHLDLSPGMPIPLIASNDRYGLPMEAMMRAMALRRDFVDNFGKKAGEFWNPPLLSLEHEVQRSIDRGGTSDQASRTAFSQVVDAQMDRLWALTITAAQKRGLDVQATRDPVEGYEVEIRIRPSNARVRIMPFLTYKECLVLHTSLEDQWTDLREGRYLLIGRYRYTAAWGKDLGGDEEGTFGVKSNSVITFEPPRTSSQNDK